MGWLCSLIIQSNNLEQAQDRASPDVRRFRLQAVPLPSSGGPGWSVRVSTINLVQLHATGGLGVQLHGTAAPDRWLQPRWGWLRPPLRGQRQQWSGPCWLPMQSPQEQPLPLASWGGCGDEEQRVQRERDRVARQWKPRQRESWQWKQWPRVSGQLQWEQQRLCVAGIFWKQQKVSGVCGNDDTISKPVWVFSQVYKHKERQRGWSKEIVWYLLAGIHLFSDGDEWPS